MWRVLNKLFGWHYVLVKNKAYRAKSTPNGMHSINIYGDECLLSQDGTINDNYHSTYLPLTFETTIKKTHKITEFTGNVVPFKK